MLYKIKSIQHNGTFGEKYSERTDGRYPDRIGRIVYIDVKNIEYNRPLVINYVRDSDGTPMRMKYLKTSCVKDFEVFEELQDKITECLTVETENSIFEFERIYEDWIENVG